VLLTTHPLLVPQSWNSRAYLYAASGPHRACNRIILPFYIYSPYINSPFYCSNLGYGFRNIYKAQNVIVNYK